VTAKTRHGYCRRRVRLRLPRDVLRERVDELNLAFTLFFSPLKICDPRSRRRERSSGTRDACMQLSDTSRPAGKGIQPQ